MYILALNAFREIIRGRFFSLIVFFVLVEICGLLFLNALSLGQAEYIVVDMGLSFIELSGVFMILFFGNRLLAREFEEKTIYLTLSRPVSRGSIIFGKFLGFSANMLILVLVLSLVLIALMVFCGVSISGIFLLSLFGIFLKILILTAVALFFAIFLSSGMATFATLAVYIVAHSGYALLEFALTHKNEAMLAMGRAILAIFPNFQSINFKNMVHLSSFPSVSHTATSILLSLCYLGIVLFLAKYIFEKKSFDHI